MILLIKAVKLNIKELQSRKWQLTINNPSKYQFNHERIKEELKEIKSCVYWCLSDEIGLNESTYHTHIYLVCSSPVRFSTLKNRFPQAHLEVAHGTSEENRNYVFKIGKKWVDDKKSETKILDTQEEWGYIPVERQGARNDLYELYNQIKEGKSTYEILEENAEFIKQLDRIERVRQTIREEQYKSIFRQLNTTYIYGIPGSGKTRCVMEKYGYENVFRVTDYQHPFDNYKGQDIIMYEEYRSSLKISDMLNYLDGYPVELPCRYCNKIACFTKVFIVSNIPLYKQYLNVQENKNEYGTWKAFLRRIHKVVHYTGKGIYKEYTIKEYMNDGFVPLQEGEKNPFDEKE